MSRPRSLPDASLDVFHAIGDPTRRRILDFLYGGERPVLAIATIFAVSLPAVSQHLRILERAGLVAQRRQGRQRYYRVTPDPLRQAAGWIDQYRRFWSGRL